MDTKNNVDPEVVLRQWRTRILNGFLAIAAGIAAVMTGATILDARTSPALWPAVMMYLVLTALVIGLAIFRRIDYRIRAWCLLIICYLAGLATLSTFGLGSSGRLYMMAVPILALILIGERPGMLLCGVSILTVVAFAFLANTGLLSEFLVRDRNSLLLADWLAELADTLGIISVIMVLLILFYRFQERTLARERRTRSELFETHKLLEEQNATLEQKVEERTQELQASNHSLQQRNAALGILNSVSEAMTKTLDLKTIMRLVGDRMREIFDVDSSIIMLVDKQSNMIHVPYEYDRNEGGYIDYVEPFPLGTGLSSRVIKTGQPLIANTLEEEIANGAYFPPEIIEKGQGSFGQSWLGVPIMSSDKVLGLIALADNRPHMFNQNHMRLLQTLSSNLGAAVENARLFNETQRLLNETEQRAHELTIINNVQEALASNLDIQSIYELIGDKVREVFQVDVVDIVTYNPESNLISMPYSYEKGDRSVISPRMPYGFRLDVINSRKEILINQGFAELALEHKNPTLTGAAPRSALFVPLLVDGNVKSIISIQDIDRENAFHESDVRILQTLANSMSIALENARLFDKTERLLEETEQRNAELAIVNSVQAGLVAKMDMQAIYDLVGDKIREIFDVHAVDIAIYDHLTDLLSDRYSFEKGDRNVLGAPVKSYGFRKHVIESRQPLLINRNVLEMSHQYNSPVLMGAPAKSCIFVPMIAGNDVIGVISIQNMDRENAFSEADVRLLQTFANSMSVALENARLFNETQRLLKDSKQHAAELATVNTVSSAITSELDLNTLIHLIGEQIRTIFSTDIAYVALLDHENNVINFPYQYGQDLEPLPYGEGLTSRIIQSGAPLLINQEMDRQREQLGARQIGKRARSYLGVPIFVRGETIGAVSVQSTTEEGIFTDTDQHLLSTIAANVGIAIQNARLFDEVKRHEREVRESAEKLRLIFETAFDGISFYEDIPSEDQRILLDCNERYCQMAGRSKEELLGISDTRCIQHRIENASEAEDQAAVMAEQVFSGVFSWIRPDGQENVIEYNAAPTKVGDRFFTIGLDRDITERVRVENELRESNEKLRLIFENAFDGISVYEEIPAENRRVLMECNERYCQMAGRSKEELLAIHDTRTIQRDLGVDAERFGWEPITAERVFAGVFSWIRPDGKENIIEYNAAPTKVGDRLFTIGLDRDVTERRRAQEELRQAKDMAEAATHAKSAFLANMSHELRTPLNAIIGFTRIVRRKAEGVLPEKQTENLDKVLISAEHLLSLINTVLDIAKIEAGRMDVLAANFRISALIDLCANTAQPLLRPGVTLEKDVDENISTIYSDQDKIRQIILNLLSNAAKFTHEGSITLSVRREAENLYIAVKDTGIGISDEALPRIFKEFQQADSGTTRQYGGTGLGLSISRNLARLLGGDINVVSEMGKGSTFTLITPIQYRSKVLPPAEVAPIPRTDLEPTPVIQTASRPAAKERILVIDDDPDAVYLLQENLDPQEFEIIGARNGQDGIRMAKEQQPQAILLDVIMPGIDGWQTLNFLKADSATAHIPVILLTIVDKKALGFRLGAAAYLLKPLDATEVRDTLRRVTKNEHTQKRLLVVDDDPTVSDMLRQFLPESEFRLDCAADGLAALRAIDLNRPDVLLLDLIMPRLDGFGVIEHLHANPKTRDLPIIVISVKDLTAEESARLKETVSLVLKKQGFEGNKLTEEIRRVLNKESSAVLSQH